MDLVWKIILVAVPSYFIGAIPSSFIMGKVVRGIDLREHGSGNLGAANAFRVLGVKSGVPVLLFDIIKGFIAVHFFSELGGGGFAYALLSTFVVVLGHNYSIFVGFSGGKGVGTTTGAFFALAPHAVVMCLVIWTIILLIVRIVSVASMVGAVFLPLTILISNRFFGTDVHPSIVGLAVVIAILVIYKHRSNLGRLRRGEEKRIF